MGLRHVLDRTSPLWLAAYAGCVTFLLYTCNYFVRMPVFAGKYTDKTAFGLDLKIAFSLAQEFGLSIFKIPTILYFPGLPRRRWPAALLTCFSLSVLPLIVMTWVSHEWQVIMVFLSAAAMCPVFALIVRFIEGRRMTESIMALFLFSIVFASGLAKTTGTALLKSGVSEDFMPGLVAMCVLPISLLLIFLLKELPPPTADDIAARNERVPISVRDQVRWLKAWWPGLTALILTYTISVGYRMYRDVFAVDIFEELLGDGTTPAIYTMSETVVGVFVTVVIGLLTLVRSNNHALALLLLEMLVGCVIVVVCAIVFTAGRPSFDETPFSLSLVLTLMIGSGAGLYLPHMLMGPTLYDRLMAVAGDNFTISFLSYLSDGLGHVGTMTVMLYDQFGSGEFSKAQFFEQMSYWAGVGMGILVVLAALYLAFVVPARQGVVEYQEDDAEVGIHKNAPDGEDDLTASLLSHAHPTGGECASDEASIQANNTPTSL
ncbi:MAG: hypothetical protein MHM6MM_000635 [Cercozoa sp. M6MM]